MCRAPTVGPRASRRCWRHRQARPLSRGSPLQGRRAGPSGGRTTAHRRAGENGARPRQGALARSRLSFRLMSRDGRPKLERLSLPMTRAQHAEPSTREISRTSSLSSRSCPAGRKSVSNRGHADAIRCYAAVAALRRERPSEMTIRSAARRYAALENR